VITLQSLPQAILHIDCDAFFASVEQSLRPELKGRPVVTGKERGIAASMSYEAKARGVTRAMRLSEIRKICPDCVILPNDYETYSLVSKRLFGIIRRFTPDVEEYSIDEAFAEITGLRRLYRTSYSEIALKIKATIERELGITVSVGLSLTKSLAKICSKHKKPAGFVCAKGYDLHHFLKTIPVSEVCGFGPSSVALLAKQRVHTIGDYVQRPKFFAKKLLGKVGEELWHELRGDKVHPIVTEPKEGQASLSKVKTFTPASRDKEFVRAQVLRNLESALIKLRRHRLRTKSLFLMLKTQSYRSLSFGAELTRPTASTLEVVPIACALFEHVFDPRQEYRQTGIYMTHLEADRENQYDLFEDACRIKQFKDLSQCADDINARFGKHTLHLGSTHCLGKFQQHLGDRGDTPLRRKKLLKGETLRQHLKIPVWKIAI